MNIFLVWQSKMSARNDQLSTLLTEEFAELRWRRDIEARLVNWTVAVCSGALTAAMTLAQFASPALFLVFAVFTSALIVGVAKRIIEKIEAESNVYEAIGQTIACIVKVDHSLSSSDKSKPYVGENLGNIGGGDGSKRTIEILRFATRFTALALIAISVLSYALKECKELHRLTQPASVCASH